VVAGSVVAGALLATAPPAGANTAGSFRVTVAPGRVAAGELRRFDFTWTSRRNVNKGGADLVIPVGWPAPQSESRATAGFVHLADGEDKGDDKCDAKSRLDVSGSGPWTVHVSGIKCKEGRSFALDYSAAQTVAGTHQFQAAANPGDDGHAVALPPVSVTVVAGPADHAGFVQQPQAAVAGSPLSPAPSVQVFDR
jgi:hypothetical protein